MLPRKEIREIKDMDTFNASPARQMLGHIIERLASEVTGVEVPPAKYSVQHPTAAKIVADLIKAADLIDEIPPVQTPQRFGNPSYREWALRLPEVFNESNEELSHYILNAFGSAQRIDYGTGHELNFIAYFDGSLRTSQSNAKLDPRDILKLFDTYFNLCRKLIVAYKLEPAGSHGVWGLDDHFHMPFILGAAELSHLSPEDSPKPKDVLDLKAVNREKEINLYFGAIAFIHQVKRGAFFEHSPILYDVSSIKNWSKVKSGMIKMYNGEVLSKFPVVQHFYFGELFPFKSES